MGGSAMKNRFVHLPILFPILFLLACTPISRVEPQTAPLVTAASTTTESTPAYQDQLSAPLTMRARRAAHSATLLPDGKVLIAGGFRQEGMREIAIASAEIYDPATKSFTSIGDMNEARIGHTATLLPDGKVLIAGGWGISQHHESAELYDPQTGQFSYTASMAAPRAGMTATLLDDGRVLIAGGDSARNHYQLAAEIYEAELGRFVPTGSLASGRAAHTATLLSDGNVLLIGGNSTEYQVLRSAEIYDVGRGEFLPTGKMQAVRHKHAAVRLQDGNVLVVGGSNEDDWLGQYASAEIYDAKSGTFGQAARLNSERFKFADAVLLLTDGNVLIGGGNRQMEIFDMQSQRFMPSSQLDDSYYFTVLTRLLDGSVLITGGYDQTILPTDQAWIYR
jgi:hypothetical protein